MSLARWTRRLTPLTLAVALAAAVAPMSASAQEPAPEGEAGAASQRSVDGYVVTAMLAGLVMFIVAKSARR